jgi:hypothetical protein
VVGVEGGKVQPLSTTTHSFVYQILELEPVKQCTDINHLYLGTTLVSRGKRVDFSAFISPQIPAAFA